MHAYDHLYDCVCYATAQGFFSNDAGSATCRSCPQGRVASNASQTSCAFCAPPKFTIGSGERQCSDCNAGYYSVFFDAAVGNVSTCSLCPTGVDCAAGSDPRVQAQFYSLRDPVTYALQTFRCEGSRCTGNASCGSNRVAAEQNPLCGLCETGFSEWNGDCVVCPAVNGGLMMGLLLLGWMCVLAVHGFAQRSSTSSALRITLLFWQVALLIVAAAAWARWASFLELNFFTSFGGSSCPFPASPPGMVVVLILGPLLSYALLLATAMCHRTTCRFGQAPTPEPAVNEGRVFALLVKIVVVAKRCALILPDFDWAAYFRTCIVLYCFTFNSVTRHCLLFFSCEELPTGRYMTSLPAMHCDSASYLTLAPLACLLIVCYALVIPVYIAVKLRAARASGLLQEPEYLRWWGVVYGPFQEGALWWGLSQMLFRLLLVAVAVFQWAQDATRLGAFSLIITASLLLVLLIKPNKEAADNAWELAALLALLVLSITRIMDAPDAWLALVTFGMGGATTVRLIFGRLCLPYLRLPLKASDSDLAAASASPTAGDRDSMIMTAEDAPDIDADQGLGRMRHTAPDDDCNTTEGMVVRPVHTTYPPTLAGAGRPAPAALDRSRSVSWIMPAGRRRSGFSAKAGNTQGRIRLDLEPAIDLPRLTLSTPRAPGPAGAVAVPHGTAHDAALAIATVEDTAEGHSVEMAAPPPGWEGHVSEGVRARAPSSTA